jgi:allophanate hydrolase
MGKFTSFVNLLDLCGVSIPARTWRSANGKTMSFGVTIIGQAGKDTEILDIGKKITELLSPC